MPNVKDFKSKKADAKNDAQTSFEEANSESSASRPKRRPGREEPATSDAQVKVVDVEEGVTSSESLHAGHVAEETHRHNDSAPDFEETEAPPKVEIHFFGSELIRTKFPKPFEVAEAVATDWLHDGDFGKIPIEHPLAHFVAQKGLQKAKDVERKVLESPVTEKVAIQVLTAGMKAQGLFNQLRERLQKPAPATDKKGDDHGSN